VFTVSEQTAQIDGLPVFWRSAMVEGTPTLYLHGVPSSSDDWVAGKAVQRTKPRWRRWWRLTRDSDRWIEQPRPSVGFLERTGGLAVDLPGFGRSGKPNNRDYTISEYAVFIERFLEALSLERVRMVVHDWGAVGLAFALAHPERVERLVVMNAVPLLDGYRWHRTARLWRTPVLGELAMGSTTRAVLRYGTCEATTAGALPDSFIDSILDHFDHGTQRAILRLYRSSPSEVLAQTGKRLGSLTMPSLVLWGERDPYIPAVFADRYAQALANAELLRLADAGHWPWLDRPDVIEQVASFLADA
jgi:pimeloyl-ACP methyl ester carboxylesterase